MRNSNNLASGPVVKLPLTSFQKSASFNSSLAEVRVLGVEVLHGEARSAGALYVIGLEVGREIIAGGGLDRHQLPDARIVDVLGVKSDQQ